jgi:hypothetical protein
MFGMGYFPVPGLINNWFVSLEPITDRGIRLGQTDHRFSAPRVLRFKFRSYQIRPGFSGTDKSYQVLARIQSKLLWTTYEDKW